jgi:hypothetical protein
MTKSRPCGRTTQMVRRAIDAHSPLPEFTVDAIVSDIHAINPAVPQKHILNSLGYLAAAGEIERIARGIYTCCSGGKPA